MMSGLDLQRSISRAVGRAFGLRHDESRTFEAGWSLYERIVEMKGVPHRKKELERLDEQSAAEVNAAAGRLRDAIEGKPGDHLGARYVQRAKTEGHRYVIFSDHHLTFTGHRTNFMGESGNLLLYVDALRQYDEAGYTLVENGDVEDLVIFEPNWLTPTEWKTRGAATDLEEVVAWRSEVRLRQLRTILDDPANQPYAKALRSFTEQGRLIRVAGNHDYDLQDPRYLQELQKHYGDLKRPVDYLLLGTGAISSLDEVAFAVLHGHQFDHATNPVAAPRMGETISECLGLYYQGPDRTWRWTYDGVRDWATGAKPFRNILSGAQRKLARTIEDELGELIEDPAKLEGEAHLEDALAKVGEALFEALFKADIAWDYFVHQDEPVRAIVDEVLSGDRFFKFRIVDEEMVRDRIRDTLGEDGGPTLIFGHTHEMRLDAWSTRQGAGAFDRYLNTASAGRYENLIWGIEIEEGVARLISWSRVPPPFGPVERRVWGTVESEGVWSAQASRDPVPL